MSKRWGDGNLFLQHSLIPIVFCFEKLKFYSLFPSWSPRKAEKERYTLLRSAYVHKKHRVQYEIRTYYKFMHFHRLTGSTLSTFLEYIERNLPEGVALKATKVEIMALPEYLQQQPPAVKAEPPPEDSEK